MKLKYFKILILVLGAAACIGTTGWAQEPEKLKELLYVDDDVKQAVFVSVHDPSTFQASVELWKKSIEGGEAVWRIENPEPIAAVIGRNGLAPVGQKREGDGRTPSGTFSIYRSFGYDELIKTDIEYHQVTAEDFWIDDPSSVWYNQWISGREPSVSHENLRREDDLYKYAIIVEYNTDPAIPGNGSAIFIHIWRGRDQPTAGCVAMAETDLLKIFEWLKLDDNPQVIIKSEQ